MELHFEPSELEFTTSFLGMPKRVAVTVHNPNSVPAIVHAISSKSQDFYFSFPEEKIIKPKRSSKFIVTFLPREEDSELTTILNVHTSVGIFPYKVIASAKGNPYRIQPVVKAHLPINGTFEFPIYLHNPHPEKLKLVNAFSSHVELFLIHKRPGIQLELAPFETINIAQAVVTGVTESNMTAFIMFKLDLVPYDKSQTKVRDIQLVTAVDLDITSKRGLFSTADVLDFGLIKYGERSKRLVFKAYSTMEKGLEIDSVYVEKSNVQNNGIYMQFASKPPISVKCKTKSQPGAPVAIANVEIDSSFLSLNKSQNIHHISGIIVAESRGGNFNATIRFQAVIFIGDILHTSKDAAFHQGIQPPAKRSVSLQNNYPFGLAIWNVSIADDARKYFKVSLVRSVVEIESNKTNPVVVIDYIHQAPKDYSTTCKLYTNVTSFEFSIFIFMGEISITVHSLGPSDTPFDFGPIKPGTRRSIFFTVTNPNSIILSLRNLAHPLPEYAILEPIEIKSLVNTGPKSIKNTNLEWEHGADFVMPANSFTLFNFSIIVPASAKAVKPLMLNLATDYKQYDLPVLYELTNSTVTFVDRMLDLKESFPGQVVSKDVRIYSSFKEDLRVLGLAVLDKDPRFYFKLKPKSELILKSQAITSIGQIRFSQSLACASNCYTGFPLHTAATCIRGLKRRFNSIEDKKIRSTIVLDTEQAKSFDAVVESELVWPQLFSHPVVHFPLTAVGNFSILNLTLTNPSIHPVIVQLLPLVIYPDAEALLDFFYEEDTELFTLKAGSPVPKLREQLEKVVGGPVPRFTLSMILQPGMSIRVRVGFLPTDYNLRSSLLLIRNNLTAIEPVVLYGKGAHINMEIDGKLARNDYLLFDILPTHLADCHNPKRLTHKLPTTLTVKRSGTPCKDRGFRVLNCKPFTLTPNETHTLEIAYTPDFLMSVNEASLQLTHYMNATPWAYDMVATVPAEMLSLCHTALPRPPFEWVMYYSCMFALVFCMICVVACAYLEGDRFITTMTQPETLSEKDAPTAQAKIDKSDAQPNGDQKEGGFFHRLFYGPRDHSYLSALEFGTGPITNVIEKCCNYVIWIFANVLMVIRGESVRSSTSKRNKRNRRRFAATGFNVVHEPIQEAAIPTKNTNVNKHSTTVPTKEKPVAHLGKTPISNFSDSMSSTQSRHEDESKSGAESSSGLKKRKNVSKKNSNDSQNEATSNESKSKPIIKVSAMPTQEHLNHAIKKLEKTVEETSEIVIDPVEEPEEIVAEPIEE
ncbi:hypothetical protein M3Y97_00877100 [Aphelenchoides bicaudatus]|nr:hypothetical protein M3Y97_00877100 [Aphelenchoides bicaudatus]